MRLLALLFTITGAVTAAESRPNILWITAEDMSPNLGCYGDEYATTPNLDHFAKDSLRYTRAFATAPVCSPARSTLVTGCYATSLGTQRLRSAFPLPDHIRGFPGIFREAGWFTSNNVKTDYNIAGMKAFTAANWDRCDAKAHWRQRRPGQPFFSIFNLTTTHQSRTSVWPFKKFEQEVGAKLPAELRHDPAAAPVWPYYPDTPLVRRTVARYYDCITLMDRQVGEILRQLEDDGLADDTIVFFYSDHGMGMPRGKRLLHDSGLHVPLMIRFPEKWRHLAPSQPGESTGRLVSFVDFAPTVLHLAGLDVPQHMQGKVFLGPGQAAPRTYVFGARDRVDEVFDLSRSVRNDRYLLVRNFMPHLSWMPPEFYSDQSDMRRELKQLAEAGKLDLPQLTYAGPLKPPVEFYDTVEDPHQIHNLAGEPKHRESIHRLAGVLHDWLTTTNDLGAFTEPDLVARIKEDSPWEFARANPALCRDVRAAAETASSHIPARIMELLEHQDPAVRYWGAVGLSIAGTESPGARKALRTALKDDAPVVRVEAANTLARLGDTTTALPVLQEELTSPSVDVRLHAIRHLELLGTAALPAKAAIQAARDNAAKRLKEHPCFLYIQFSADAALKGLAAGN